MDILKTFELFWQLPVSLIKKNIVNIIHTESSLQAEKSIDVEILRNAVQMNIVNNEKMYNLLTTVLYKRRKLDEQNSKTKSKIFKKLAIFK